MAFLQDTSTDYIDLLDDLLEFLTTDGLLSVDSVAAGGTGYAVGDILTCSGGTSTHDATVEVTAVDGTPAVTAAIVVEAGNYTATPGDPVTMTGGSGSGCTLNLTFSATGDKGWTIRRETKEGLSATVSAGGTGYNVGDTIELDDHDSVGRGVKTVFTVATVSGGPPGPLLTVTNPPGTPGDYEETATNPVPTTAVTGSGSGATLTVTYQPVSTPSDKVVILEGEGGGSDQIFLGIKTYQSGSARNWELQGFTGYDANSTFATQPGISPGVNPASGKYVPLSSSTIDQYWFQCSGFHINMVAKISTAYPNMSIGWVDRFATAAEYPYPELIMGCSSDATLIVSSTSIGYSGMVDPVAHAAGASTGPGVIRDPGGTWKNVRNSRRNNGGRTANSELVVFPAGQPDITGVSSDDLATDGNYETTLFIPNSGNPGTENLRVTQTPDSPNDISIMWPAVVIEATPLRRVLGQIRDVYWVSAQKTSGLLQAEDTITDGTQKYIVFQNCRRTDIWTFFALKRI
jgi:hypothetical protein